MANVDTSRLCIDTATLVAYLRNREPGASAVERAVKEGACFSTAITAYELSFGTAHIGWAMGEAEILEALIILPFDKAAAKRAARVHYDLIHSNSDIGIKDIYITAICLEHGLPILTPNQRHFSRVPGLVVITPEQFLSTHR